MMFFTRFQENRRVQIAQDARKCSPSGIGAVTSLIRIAVQHV